jgi:hypothetical protein
MISLSHPGACHNSAVISGMVVDLPVFMAIILVLIKNCSTHNLQSLNRSFCRGAHLTSIIPIFTNAGMSQKGIAKQAGNKK